MKNKKYRAFLNRETENREFICCEVSEETKDYITYRVYLGEYLAQPEKLEDFKNIPNRILN